MDTSFECGEKPHGLIPPNEESLYEVSAICGLEVEEFDELFEAASSAAGVHDLKPLTRRPEILEGKTYDQVRVISIIKVAEGGPRCWWRQTLNVWDFIHCEGEDKIYGEFHRALWDKRNICKGPEVEPETLRVFTSQEVAAVLDSVRKYAELVR